MSQVHVPVIQGPPVDQVGEGDVVWVPVWAAEQTCGAPFWMRITVAGPVEERRQHVTGVRIVPHTDSAGVPEVNRTLQVVLPLDRVARRRFEPTEQATQGRPDPDPPADTLPRRQPGAAG